MKKHSAVTKLEAINESLRKQVGVSKSALKRGLKRVHPVLPRNKTGRNKPCACGSGKKYKNCCL